MRTVGFTPSKCYDSWCIRSHGPAGRISGRQLVFRPSSLLEAAAKSLGMTSKIKVSHPSNWEIISFPPIQHPHPKHQNDTNWNHIFQTFSKSGFQALHNLITSSIPGCKKKKKKGGNGHIRERGWDHQVSLCIVLFAACIFNVEVDVVGQVGV